MAGVLCVNAVAFILLLPEVIHGIYPGFTWDQFTELVPWSSLTWSQVHHGHLPLWNPYSALGTPLAFNWQSAPFSITSIVGYLLPEHWAYTSSVVLSAMIAGTGAYLFGRVLRLGVLGSAMAGVTFVLCGSFVGVLGWPAATVASWLGWLFAAIVLVVRGRRRTWSVAFLAVIVAQTVYAGQLDMLAIVAIATMLFVFALFAIRIRKGNLRAQLRPAGALTLSIAAGAALSAPLLLPGLQLATTSAHTDYVQSGVLTPEVTLNVIFPAIGGLLPGTYGFYYIGLIGAALALVGAIARWRSVEVCALAAMSVVLGCVAFLPVAYSWLERLPEGSSVRWVRITVPFCFGLAMLAGVGADLLARRPYQRRFPQLLTAVFVGATLLVAGVWAFASSPVRAAFRTQTFFWIAMSIVVGLSICATLLYRQALGRRTHHPDQSGPPLRSPSKSISGRLGRGWWAVVLLITCETVFLLVAAGPNLVTTSTMKVTPIDTALASKARTALVGFSAKLCIGELPMTPELNDALDVRELPAYDPMLPNAYFTVWQAVSGTNARPSEVFAAGTTFCPAITSARIARLFGVGLVVTPHGAPGPSGTVFDGTIGDVDLYRVPGAAVATVSRLRPDGTLPGPNASGHTVSATQPYPGAWRITTSQPTRQVLRVRVTNVPGWHATIDGRPLALQPFDKVMLQARLPRGHHTILLTYWPTAFTVGLWLAGIAAIALVGALVIDARRRPGRARQARARVIARFSLHGTISTTPRTGVA